MMKKILNWKNTYKNPPISTAILELNFKCHLLKTEMQEWKNDYIFCYTAELLQNEAKDPITMH